MSTQNANESKQTNENYEKEINKSRNQIDNKDAKYIKLYIDYMTNMFITSYKHIKFDDYLDFENFIFQFDKLFNRCVAFINISFIWIAPKVLIKYITENFNREVVLNWVYKNAYMVMFKWFNTCDDADDLLNIYEYDIKNNSLFENLTLSLIKFYMTTNDENDLKIIQNYFPSFEYSEDKNIHKIFWETEYHELARSSPQMVLWNEFIWKYKYNGK